MRHTAEEEQTRLAAVAVWLSDFKVKRSSDGEDVEIKPFAAETINAVYWELLEDRIRPYIENNDLRNIDHHKIISLTELCVMRALPILHPDIQRVLHLNATLAFGIGVNILRSWRDEPMDLDDEGFIREHHSWLRWVSTAGEFPIFSNAATWYLFELCGILKARLEQR